MARRPTGPAGYTAVRCGAAGCRSELDADISAALSQCVCSSGHGVLVVAGCCNGRMTCKLRPPGQMLLVQSCDVDRSPRGPAVLIGPISSQEDVDALRSCLKNGRFDVSALPPHLLAVPRQSRAAARN
jgi:hypothetical protein